MTAAVATAEEHAEAGVLATLRATSAPVRALLVGVLVNRLGTFFQAYLVLFLTTRGFSSAQAGWALGGYGAGTIGGLLAGGALADRLGPRRTTLLSMAGSAVLLPAVLYLHRYAAILVVVALVGLSTQLFRPAASAMLASHTARHRRVMIFAVYRLVQNIGASTAPLLGALLVAVSYTLLYWVEAGSTAVFALVAVFLFPRGRDGAKSGAPVRGGYGAMLGDRRYVLFLGAMFLNIFVYVQYIAVLPLAMRAEGLATGWYAAMLALNGLMVVAFELLVTKVTQRRAPRYVAAAGFLLLGVGQGLYGFGWGVVAFVAGTVLWSLAELVGGPTMFAYPALAAPEELLGRYQGAAQAMFGLGTVLGPICGVALWLALGPPVWWLFGAASLLGLVVAWTAMRDTQPAAKESANA
ncbi:MFS transporter [Dactylosporangium sp. NPDC051485]|uniref:MFS transporter n=1 Tax=Dactylosporangium sp. NPDC051485 TaxID=3154846 RepID=UPI0034449C2C